MTEAAVTLEIPSSLNWLDALPAGRVWLEALPATVRETAQRWNLELGQPFADCHVSLVLPAQNQDLVVKIQFPDRESRHEAAALAVWTGNGAVLLVDHWVEKHVLLLERCVPGIHLAKADPATGLDVIIGLLPRLWVPATKPFGSLAAEVATWVRNLPHEYESAGRPFARSLLDEAIEVLTGLAGSQGELVLIHQDLHGDNVLRSQREPWLAIDPKPLRGEREFGLSPMIRSYEFGHSREAVVHRLDRLSGELGLDRERARLWAFGQAIAWGFEGGRVLARHMDTARWLLDA